MDWVLQHKRRVAAITGCACIWVGAIMQVGLAEGLVATGILLLIGTLSSMIGED